MGSPLFDADVSPVGVIRAQLDEARAAQKCHACGCLQETVEALEGTELGRGPLSDDLAGTRALFTTKSYDCLGCPVCYPAIAANAYAEAFAGEGAALDLCPTEAPVGRTGWPPLPGEYEVLRYDAPVAVCVLTSGALVKELTRAAPAGLSIAGTLHTENLGIERIIRNVLGNPHLRRLIVCGEDSRQAVGHLPGQSLLSLFSAGIDDRGRIRDARGKRPILKNVSAAQVEAFRRQVQVVPMLGETDLPVSCRRSKKAPPLRRGCSRKRRRQPTFPPSWRLSRLVSSRTRPAIASSIQIVGAGCFASSISGTMGS